MDSDSSGNSDIFAAVKNKQLKKLKQLVESGSSVNINDENDQGNAPLHVAAITNGLAILDYLLSLDDIIINIRNTNTETPLFSAVKHRNLDSVRRLIKAGAKVNLPNCDKISPLHVAVTQPEMCRLLIEHGADINALDFQDISPLHRAVEMDCLETVCMLLYFGADPDTPDSNNHTPFMLSLISENVDVQQALLEYVIDFNTKSYSEVSTIELALKNGSPFAEEIIRKGGDVNRTLRSNIYTNLLSVRTDYYEQFPLVWSKLNLMVDMTFVFNYYLVPKCSLEWVIEVILESENLDLVVNSFMRKENLDDFINKFYGRGLDLDQLTRLVCRLLCGGYNLTVYDIENVFSNYGYCELFKIFLYTSSNSFLWPKCLHIPRIIFDFRSDPNDIEVFDGRGIIDTYYLEQLWEYTVNPTLLRTLKEDDYFRYLLPKMFNLPTVPLLTDLARNKARQHVADSFHCKTTCQFYTVVNNLDLPNCCKMLMTFERKLYRV